MRLFAAVIPPPAAIEELAAEVAQLRAALPERRGQLRWTDPATWHFTLAFLGEVDDALLPGLGEHLARAAHRHPAHELRFAGGGRFGDRVLWVGATGSLETVGSLARSTIVAARQAGVHMDDARPFRPHLTLARVAGRVNLRPYAEELSGFRGRRWRVERLELVRSHLGGGVGGRPRYETVAAWPLGTRRAP
ncbi:RNA 2',3'-cyclic phosphodiesterase [Streptosporangium nondiastaticum]|uniref:RNA 2',3'-cyclic phosphodiesterase n=1 Tax=Streptosporangium nondiastaticum TaxID=35764 RepID=A0A9X7PJZ2_9ACTN|nr:RNA 2',3'-cyclic phosphodiesterase [Streptosporangium nondiastaticum]PSJ30596.1 RNA 2',3'-cyclic phosphodiesterase [Streptosporangium nondiastaticum]